MARTRAQRRHNTAKKCRRRKALTTNCGDNFGVLCSGNVTPSGEACACSRCLTDKKYQESWNSFESKKLSEFIRTNY